MSLFISVPTMFCLADGNWSTSAGGCQCAPGYQPNRALTECNGEFNLTVLVCLNKCQTFTIFVCAISLKKV